MNESPVSVPLVQQLEQRQEEVIRQLDELLVRLEQTLAEWSTTRQPKAAPAQESTASEQAEPLRRAA